MRDISLRSPIDPEIGRRIIDAAGTPDFASVMLDAARRIDHVEEIFAYEAGDSGAPRALAWSSTLQNTSERVDFYARRFFRHDPALRYRKQVAVGTGFAHRVTAAEIIPHDYRAICFEAPRFVDKLCFGWRSEQGMLVISFYRQRNEGSEATQRLAALADLGLAALRRSVAPAYIAGSGATPVERVEHRLEEVFPMLTLRERQVCARTIAGWTAGQTAKDLGIRSGTVLTYRQRAYSRIGFSSSHEFALALLAN